MNIPTITFEPMPKIARLSREIIVTEKIDGTNGTVYVAGDGDVCAASRTKWITPESDNYGFAKWVELHSDELRLLGPGLHRGEWWGGGIQRNYGLKEKRWSLFNVQRWVLAGRTPAQIPTQDPRIVKMQDVLPSCCGLVPTLYRGEFDQVAIFNSLEVLRQDGSQAAPGFKKPEGVVVFHVAAGIGFKKTIEHDETPKARQ